MAKKLTKVAFAKNALRQAFKRYPSKNQCKKDARVERGKYKCAACKELFKEAECEVDHRESVVPLDKAGKDQSMDEYVDRLFVEADMLDCLCKTCHKAKSSTEMGMRKINRQRKKDETK